MELNALSLFIPGDTVHTTIQSAVNAAHQAPGGAVWIPASYTGHDTYTNPSSVPVFDMRGVGSTSFAVAGSPGGSTTQVQFNDSSAFGGDANFAWDKATGYLNIGQPTDVQYGVVNVKTTTGQAAFNGQAVGTDVSPYALEAHVEHRGTVGYATGIDIGCNEYGTCTGDWGIYSAMTARPGCNLTAAWGCESDVFAASANPLTNAYGFYTTIGKFGSGSITNAFGYYQTDLTGVATNGYYAWFDSPGVWRVKADGVMAYYNPSFGTKYTPGGTNYERIVQQWNTNVAEIGTEASGTGTLRSLRVIGVGLSIPGSTPATAGATGLAGTITWDADFIYICTATNTWKKVGIASW